MPSPPPLPRPPRPLRPARPPGFSPRFTLSLLYVFALVVAFGLAFALPDLLAAARALPPGPDELTPEELAHAREIARAALAGKVPYAIASALLTFGLLVWRGWLPGIRPPAAGSR